MTIGRFWKIAGEVISNVFGFIICTTGLGAVAALFLGSRFDDPAVQWAVFVPSGVVVAMGLLWLHRRKESDGT